MIKERQLQVHIEGIRNTLVFSSDCTKSLLPVIPNGNNRQNGTKVNCITCLIEEICSDIPFYSLDTVSNVPVDECYY